jgi:uncharacterized protein
MILSTDQINLLQQYFSTRPVLKAYVFGSFVRGEATDESDVDVLVELDYERLKGLDFVEMYLELQELLGRKVDLVSARGLSKHIGPFIEKEKKLIYAR